MQKKENLIWDQRRSFWYEDIREANNKNEGDESELEEYLEEEIDKQELGKDRFIADLRNFKIEIKPEETEFE